MRYLSSSTAKDVRRHRLFEKALDALATSPYARSVEQWVLAGWRIGFFKHEWVHQMPWDARLPTICACSAFILFPQVERIC
jgi:hypothetical protein